MKNIASRVTGLRKRMGISQKELGERIRYSRTYISMVERGVQEDPGAEFIERIEALEKHGTAQDGAVVCDVVSEYLTGPTPSESATQSQPRQLLISRLRQILDDLEKNPSLETQTWLSERLVKLATEIAGTTPPPR